MILHAHQIFCWICSKRIRNHHSNFSQPRNLPTSNSSKASASSLRYPKNRLSAIRRSPKQDLCMAGKPHAQSPSRQRLNEALDQRFEACWLLRWKHHHQTFRGRNKNYQIEKDESQRLVEESGLSECQVSCLEDARVSEEVSASQSGTACPRFWNLLD